jgi:glycosyltransferase involved in cell wall biosynthesis
VPVVNADIAPVVPAKIQVSVVVITRNEERAIERCLRSLTAYSEVFVVDSHSDDRTAEFAAGCGATVVQFEWNGQYPKKKQWALENLPLRHDWVLYLDGDEYSTPEFDAEVDALVKSPTASAYDVGLDYVFLGRTLRHGHKVFKRVLFDRTRCAWPVLDDLSVANPFEMELHVQPVVHGSVRRTTARLVHDDLEPIAHYFDRHNRYSDWEAVLLQNRDRGTSVERTWQGRLWGRVPGKPGLFFMYAYVARGGFRDGAAGFHYAVANTFYYWQIRLKSLELRTDSSASKAGGDKQRPALRAPAGDLVP